MPSGRVFGRNYPGWEAGRSALTKRLVARSVYARRPFLPAPLVLCAVHITGTEVILYVADQAKSAVFYRALLGKAPTLDVPGMTAFGLGPGCMLGLMPATGIARIISGPLPHPSTGAGIPRCELYLLVDDLERAVHSAIAAGAQAISPAADRDWGHRVAYYADPDGHVIALAVSR